MRILFLKIEKGGSWNFLYESVLLRRKEKGIEDCQEQIAGRDMERTIGIFRSKIFEFFMRVEFIVERQQKEDDREQIAARDIKRTIGTFGSNSFEF